MALSSPATIINASIPLGALSDREIATRIDGYFQKLPGATPGWGPWKLNGGAFLKDPKDLVSWPDTLDEQEAILDLTPLRDSYGKRAPNGSSAQFQRESDAKPNNTIYRWSTAVKLGYAAESSIGNMVNMVMPSIDQPNGLPDSVSESCFHLILDYWQPTKARLITRGALRSLDKLNKHKSWELDIIRPGFRTYLSHETVKECNVDVATLPDTVAIDELANGILLSVPGTLANPDIDAMIAIGRTVDFISSDHTSQVKQEKASDRPSDKNSVTRQRTQERKDDTDSTDLNL